MKTLYAESGPILFVLFLPLIPIVAAVIWILEGGKQKEWKR
jgi:hypothetical protein